MAKLGATPRRIFWGMLMGCCAALFGYVVFRAIHLSFVHDESLSFKILLGEDTWRFTANHHPLNTFLMQWFSRRFGNSEWALRIPNVVSYLFYLTAGMLLLRRLRSLWIVCLGFALLNLNPFLLDFFGLARGYGMASGFALTALYFFTEAWNSPGTSSGERKLFLSLVFAALADLGNFAWINFHLALLAGALALVFFQGHSPIPRVTRRTIAFSAILVFTNGWFLYDVARRVIGLQRDGQLYAGAKTITEMATSLVQTYLYTASYGQTWRDYIFYSVLIALLGIGLWLVYRLVTDRRLEISTVLYGVLLLTVLAPIAEHLIWGSLFPLDRTALSYMPLVALVIVFPLDKLKQGVSKVVSLVITMLMVIHFSKTANLTHTLIWRYDADTKAAMLELEKRFAGSAGTVRIGNTWLLEPSINYYRVVRHLDWLSPATREGVLAGANDILFGLSYELTDLRPLYSLVREYTDSGTQLLLRKPAP